MNDDPRKDTAKGEPETARALLAARRYGAGALYPFLGPGSGEDPLGTDAGKPQRKATVLDARAAAVTEFRESAEWGDSLEAGPWNFCVPEGSDSFDLARRLYAEAFAGCPPTSLRHVVYCGAEEESVHKALVSLGFGLEQVYGYRSLAGTESSGVGATRGVGAGGQTTAAPGLRVGRLGEANRRDLDALWDLVVREHAEGPTWAGLPASYGAAVKEGFSELWADPEATVFVAYEGDLPAGYQCWFADSPGVAELSVGAVLPDRRGRGIGTALFDAAAADFAGRGFGTVITDWRSANLSSSRFWPARGFAPYLYRFVRRFHPYQLR